MMKNLINRITWIQCILLVLLITYLSRTEAFSQVQFGAKAAFNYSTFRGNADLKSGYQFGVAGKKYLGELGWFFQPELVYSFEGAENQPIETINVPLLLGFDFSETFNMQFGFQPSFIIGTRNVLGFEYSTFSPNLNIGVEFYPSKKTSAGFRADYGLKDIDKSEFVATPVNFEVYFLWWLRM